MIVNYCYDYQKPVPSCTNFTGGNRSFRIDSNLIQAAKGIKQKVILPFGLFSFQLAEETTRNTAMLVYKLSLENCCLSKEPEASTNQFILGLTALLMSIASINFSSQKIKVRVILPFFLVCVIFLQPKIEIIELKNSNKIPYRRKTHLDLILLLSPH